MNKILVAIFGILLTITVVEAIFLLYSGYSGKQQAALNSAEAEKRMLSLNRYVSSGINAGLRSAIVNLNYDAIIDKVITTPGSVKTGNNASVNYQEGLLIKGTRRTTYLLFSSVQLKYLKVYQLVNGVEKPIQFNDLSVGDHITAEIVRNLLLPSSAGKDIISIKIVKIKE